MKRTQFSILTAFMGFAALLCAPLAALSQTAPPLGVLDQFGILGGSAVTGSTTAGSVVNGDVGSYPTASISNFPPTVVTPGFLVHYTPDGVVQQARTDATIAFGDLAAQVLVGPTTAIPLDDLGGLTLTPGIYTCGACLLPTTEILTLNDPTGTGIFIFDVSSALTADVLSDVVGTANPCNVYWRVNSSATINGDNFFGTIIAGVSITIGSGSNLLGRAIAGTGAVTMPGAGARTIGGCATAVPAACPTITLNPASLTNPTVGTPYSASVTATGGVGPYTYAVTSGALPAGLVLDGNTGAITGTPSSLANFNFTITATDSSSGCTASRAYTVATGLATAIPALDSAGLMMMMLLLLGAGMIVIGRFTR